MAAIQGSSYTFASCIMPSEIPLELARLPMTYHPSKDPTSQLSSAQTNRENQSVFRESSRGSATNLAENELQESSRLTRPTSEMNVAYALQTLSNPGINKLRLLCVCLLNFTNGVNDSAPGALLPSIESAYSVNYAVVSTIFLVNACGYLTSAFLSHYVYDKLGRARTIAVSCILMSVGCTMLVSRPSAFAIVALSFFFLGAGISLNLAQCNVFCTGLANSGTMLGYSHGSYGLGGTVGPLIATSLVSHGIGWNLFYFAVLSLSLFNLAICLYAFRNSESELLTGQHINPMTSNALQQDNVGLGGMLKNALRSKATLITAFFIFCYTGAEVSIGGWIVTFLVTARKGNPEEVGYVASGFWLGITVGRFLLSYPCNRIGEKRAVFGLLAGAVLFEILVWSVPNIVSNAVSFALVGLLLGPIYPCTMNVITRLIARNLHVPSLSFIAAFGAGGGAISPFTTGLLAQVKGAFVLNPVAISLFCAMEGSWLILAKMRPKVE